MVVGHKRVSVTCDPFRVGPLEGRCSWVAGTQNVPLPTATPFEPLRGSEGQGAARPAWDTG
jgi:hypothetical protein